MAAFMGKDVKKLKAKGGGKVSTPPGPRFSITYYDLSRKTTCGCRLEISQRICTSFSESEKEITE